MAWIEGFAFILKWSNINDTNRIRKSCVFCYQMKKNISFFLTRVGNGVSFSSKENRDNQKLAYKM